MTQGILLALGAAVVYGFLGVCYETAAKRGYRIWDVGLFMQLTGFLIGLTVTVLHGSLLFDVRLLLMGMLGGASFVLSIYFYLSASRERDIGANWTIVNLSVVLPILVSILWFRDAFTLMKGLGVVGTLASIAVIGGGIPKTGAGRPSSQWFLFISLAFCANAILPILLRFVPAHQSVLFTTYLYGTGLFLFLSIRLATSRDWKMSGGLIRIAAGAAATHWCGIVLTMAALGLVGSVSKQAGVIVYPITNGLVIPCGVVLGAMILKQTIPARSKWGVALGVLAMVSLSFS